MSSTLDPQYVTGFTDGEGSFTYSRSGRQIAMYYALKVSAADRAILEQIHEFFHGVGRMYEVKGRAPTHNSGFTKAAILYRVTHREELTVIIAHFDKYPLRTKKLKAYEIWRTMVLLKRAYREPDRDLLNKLADLLSEAQVRNQVWTPRVAETIDRDLPTTE